MSEFFENKGIESPRKVADILLCHVLACSRLDLYMQFDRPFADHELEQLRNLVKRVGAGEPVQHVLGEAPFASLVLDVNNNVLIPRPETEEVLAVCVTALDRMLAQNRDKVHVLDIGTGSGALALAIAQKFPDVQCIGIDVSHEAIETATRNAKRCGLKNVAFFASDILSVVPQKRYDLVVSNPPYIPSSEYDELEPIVKNYEPKVALTDGMDGLTFYRRFGEIFGAILKPHGEYVLECGWNQASTIVEMLEQRGLRAHAQKDMNENDRIVYGGVLAAD